MALTLILKTPAIGDQPESQKTLELKGDPILIGRHPSSNVVLTAKQVSRRHAELVLEGKTWYLHDLGSGNGTWLNGSRMAPEEKLPLKVGDIVGIDKYQIIFQTTPGGLEKSMSEITDSDILEVKMIKKILSAMDKDLAPSLEGVASPIEGKKVFLTEDRSELIIGRDQETDFPIEDPTISRRHAKLVRKWGSIVLVDLKSKNGTFVGSEKITERTLRDGDRVAFGHVKLIYRNPQEINYEALGEKRPSPVPSTIEAVPSQELPQPGPALQPLAAEPTARPSWKALELALLIIGGAVVVLGIWALILILK